MLAAVEKLFSVEQRETLWLRAFGLGKVPLIAFAGPKIDKIDNDKCQLRIPLNWRTKNHVGSLYLGALAIGGELAPGVLAMRLIRDGNYNATLVFKDFKAEFLRRADGDTVFTCEDGAKIKEQLDEMVRTQQRVDFPVQVLAHVPASGSQMPVAKFELTLSIKANK